MSNRSRCDLWTSNGFLDGGRGIVAELSASRGGIGAHAREWIGTEHGILANLPVGKRIISTLHLSHV